MTFASVEEAEKALRVVDGRIDRHEGQLEQLYDERGRIFKFLLDAGRSQASIAESIGKTPMVVKGGLRRLERVTEVTR